MSNIKKYKQFIIESTTLYCKKCGEYKGDEKEGNLCAFCDKPNSGEGDKLNCIDCGEYIGGLKDSNLCDSCENKEISEDSNYMMDIAELRLQLAHYIEVLDHSEISVMTINPDIDLSSNYLEDINPDIKFNRILLGINNSALDLEEGFTINSFKKFCDDEFLRLEELERRLIELDYNLEFFFDTDKFQLSIYRN